MEVSVMTILFWLTAVVSIGLAIAVVTTTRILRAAVYLSGVLIGSAGLFIILDMDFLAAVQVLVYVGGIVVLLVFAIMLTGSVELVEVPPTLMRKMLGGFAALGFFMVTVAAFYLTYEKVFPTKAVGDRPVSDVEAIGKQLLSYDSNGYVLPFEVISLLLLGALIGGIVVARKAPEPEEGGTES